MNGLPTPRVVCKMVNLSPQWFAHAHIRAGRGGGGGRVSTCVGHIHYSGSTIHLAAVDFHIRLCTVGLVNDYYTVLRGLSRPWVPTYQPGAPVIHGGPMFSWEVTLFSPQHPSCTPLFKG